MDGRLVVSRKLIRKRALEKRSFLPTAISATPLSLLLCFHSVTDVRWLQFPRVVRLLRVIPMLMEDPIAKQQPSSLEELLRIIRLSQLDLQYAQSKILPLLGAYVLLAHYIACIYWAVCLSEVDDTALLADVNASESIWAFFERS